MIKDLIEGYVITPYSDAYPCPNCGKNCRANELVHTSTKKYGIGAIVSTLYGVCSSCAKSHGK